MYHAVSVRSYIVKKNKCTTKLSDYLFVRLVVT